MDSFIFKSVETQAVIRALVHNFRTSGPEDAKGGGGRWVSCVPVAVPWPGAEVLVPCVLCEAAGN